MPRGLNRFGTPGSIDPARLRALPAAMQGEGIRLLLEMGESRADVQRRLGLAPDAIGRLLAASPFRRGGEEMAKVTLS